GDAQVWSFSQERDEFAVFLLERLLIAPLRHSLDQLLLLLGDVLLERLLLDLRRFRLLGLNRRIDLPERLVVFLELVLLQQVLIGVFSAELIPFHLLPLAVQQVLRDLCELPEFAKLGVALL